MSAPFVLRWRRSLLACETLSPNERLVALVLMDHMDGDGSAARPEIRRLAAEAGLPRQTAHDALSSLVESRWLDRRSRGRSRPVEYRARLPERASPPVAAALRSPDNPGHFRTEVQHHQVVQRDLLEDLDPEAVSAARDAARAREVASLVARSLEEASR